MTRADAMFSRHCLAAARCWRRESPPRRPPPALKIGVVNFARLIQESPQAKMTAEGARE